MSGGGLYAAKGFIRKQEKQIADLESTIALYLRVINEYRAALTHIQNMPIIDGAISSDATMIAAKALHCKSEVDRG